LTVGSNNLSTRVDGTINDGGIAAFTGASLVKIGTGTLTLAGTNTYTGGTTISAGIVEAAHASAGSIDALGTGTVTLNGGTLRATVSGALANDLTFADSTSSTLSAAAGTTLILGSGSTGNLTFGTNATATFGSTTDTGTIVVGQLNSINPPTFPSTYSVVVAGGTLQDANDLLAQLLFSADKVTVNAGATIDFNDSALQFITNLNGSGNVKTGSAAGSPLQLGITSGTQTFGGVISGAHGLFINALGFTPVTMVFTGDNTYTGGTTICFCTTLQLGNGGTTGSILGDVTNGGTLAFNRSDSYTFNGIISDDFTDAGQVRQIGTGKTILTATSTYTGNTFVDAGTLIVNGDIRTSFAAIVNSGGTLGGDGYVPSTLIRAGGTLAPGNSVGTLNVVGNLQFITGSTYAVEVSSTGADRTNVSGSTILGGATVAASIAADSTVNKQYTILNSTSGFTGRFNSSVTTSSNYAASLSYDTNNVYLTLSLAYGSGTTGLDQNQQNVGNALNNYFNANSGIPGVYGTLTANGLTQLSGQPGASIPQAGFIAIGQFINTMMDGAGNTGGPSGGATGFAEEDDALNAYAPKRKLSRAQTDAYATVTPRDRMPTPFASRWSVWATGYGGNATINGSTTSGSHSTSTRVYGTSVGANYRLSPDTLLGFAAGAAGTNFTVDSALGGGRADVFQMGAYARHTMGAAYLAGALAYAWQDVTTDRTVTVSGTDKLHAQLKANALSARLEGGWRYGLLPVAVTPYAALQSTAFYLPSYAETATSGSNQFALSYGSKTVTATRSELGARFDKTLPLAMPFNDAVVTLRGRAAWAHDWNTDRSAIATFQSLPGATFAVNGAQPSANAALLSAGADIAWGNGWTIAATFDGEFSNTTRGYAGKGTLRYAW
jgi:autotransporter-associated beta strand protein